MWKEWEEEGREERGSQLLDWVSLLTAIVFLMPTGTRVEGWREWREPIVVMLGFVVFTISSTLIHFLLSYLCLVSFLAGSMLYVFVYPLLNERWEATVESRQAMGMIIWSACVCL